MLSLKRPANYFCICVEGLISTGKSTLVAALSTHPAVTAFPEDLPSWKNLPGAGGDASVNMLAQNYADMARWGGAFQLMVAESKLRQHAVSVSTAVKVIEGSLGTSFHVYTMDNKSAGLLSNPDAAVCQAWYKFATDFHAIAPHKTIFLDVSPEVALKRIASRGRPEEQGITLGYLENLHASYSSYFANPEIAPFVTVIKADGPPAEVLAQVKKELSFLLGEW
jgi:deoxyadenosine/deoxycytidine kinase